MTGTEDNINEMLKIRRDKLKELQDMGEDPFLIEKYEYTHHSMTIKENFEELEGETVSVAGRLMSRERSRQGKLHGLQDSEGRIQIFAKQDVLGKKHIRS